MSHTHTHTPISENDFLSETRALHRHMDEMIYRSRRYLAEAQETLTRREPDLAARGDVRVGAHLPPCPQARLPPIRDVLADISATPKAAPDISASAPATGPILAWLDSIPDRADSPLPLSHPQGHPQGRGQKRTFGDMVTKWEARRDPKGPTLISVDKEDNPEGEMIGYLFGPGGGEKEIWRSPPFTFRRSIALLTEPMEEPRAKVRG